MGHIDAWELAVCFTGFWVLSCYLRYQCRLSIDTKNNTICLYNFQVHVNSNFAFYFEKMGPCHPTSDGCITGKACLAFYKQFDKHLDENSIKRPIVVMTDGHSSRFDFDVLKAL